jgi:DNA-binding GntR family transcriptional regulator
MSHDGRQDLEVAREWLHLNHSFHDVIYRAADVPLIERMAKAARRTFLVKPSGRPEPTSTSSTEERPAAPSDP